ncbi:helix-turn-helix domain-containing protein [Burkholderia sp. BCC0405]|uniref:helix-turn-helix domain-containing protein n=1 Tax=Burkholderia sp. BCC0405 TaxID=2676298 RepID=UPI001FC8B1EE|nr:helix-turn-helix domain-containing protein [Burkholderia sp. BCC0405]
MNYLRNPLNASRRIKKDDANIAQTSTRRGHAYGDHRFAEELCFDRILAGPDICNHRLNGSDQSIGRSNLSDVSGQDVGDGWLAASDAPSNLALRPTSSDECPNHALKINIHDPMIVTTITQVNRNFGRPIDKNSYMDKPYDLMTVGGRVRYAREKLAQPKRLSQRALAKMAGMSQPTLWALENGEGETARIVDLAAALNVNPRWLARGEGKPQDDIDQSFDDKTLEKSPITSTEKPPKESDKMLSLDGISDEMRVIIEELARIDRTQGRRRGILLASIGAIIATTEPSQDETPEPRSRKWNG